MSTLSPSVVPGASRWLRRSYAIGLLALVSGAAFLCGRTAFGVTYVWNVAGPADWNNAANWNPAGGPPGTLAADNALVDNGGTATIDPTGFGSGPIATFDNLTFDGVATGGTVNQLSGTVSLAGAEAPAVPAGPGEMRMGTLTGAAAGATNTYDITGGSFSTTGTAAGGGYVYIGQTGGNAAPLSEFIQGVVGDFGTTSVTIGSSLAGIAGSRLEIGGGQSATGGNGKYILNTGTLTLNGNGVGMEIGRVGTGAGTANGELDVNGGTLNAGTSGAPQTSDVYLGRGTGSVGKIEQTDGAVNIGIRSNNNLVLGMAGDGFGQYDLSGGVLTVGNTTAAPPANDSSGGTLILGNATPATAGKVTGILNISGTGDLEVNGFRALVGNATGASGTITMNGTSGIANFAGGLTLGAATSSTAVLNVHGGNFTVTNGDTLIGNADGSHATVNQDGGIVSLDSGTNNNWAFVGSGGSGNGTYNLSNGAMLNVGNNFPHGNGRLVIARTSGAGSGTFNISGAGTTLNTGNDMDVDNGGTGIFNQGAGTTVNVGQWLFLGTSGNAGASGTYNMMGGTLATERLVDGGNTSNGSNGGTGHFIQTGGSFTSRNDMSLADGPSTADYTISGASSGPNAVTMTTGTIIENATRGQGMLIGWGGNGTMNQNGGLVTVGQEGIGFNGGGNAGANGVYNLSGGVLNTAAVYKMGTAATNGTGTFNFNGGILQVAAPTGNRAIFMGPGNPNLSDGTVLPELTAANVQAGGAIFDTNGYNNITVSQDLLHGTVAALDGGLTLADSSGTAGAVNLLPGSLLLTGNNSFTGDTNVTNNAAGLHGLLILGSATALQGSTLNMTFDSGPGAAAPMVQFAPGFGGFVLGGLKGSANLALPDTGGAGITLEVGGNNQNTTYTGVLSDTGGAAASGLFKQGSGTLHLTAVQAYTGPTQINNGTLSLNGASIAASSAVMVGGPTSNGPNPTLLAQNGANAGKVTVGNYGTFGAGDVSIANANSLTVNDSGAIAFTLGSASSPNSDLIAVSGALTLPTVGVAKVNLADNAGAGGLGSIGPGTYKLITYGSLTNVFDPLSLSPGVVALPGDSYIFSQTGSEIDVQIVAAKSWSGGASPDKNWSTGGNWSGLTPGATGGSTTNSDTADFNGAGNANTIVTVDAGRNVRSVTFETAAAAAYTIGSAGPNGGPALLLSNGGTIQNTSAVANDQIVNAPLVLEGANARYTFSANSATNVLKVGGGITGGAAGATILTLTGGSTGANIVSGAIGNGSATSVALYKTGAGSWVLSGANTFTGGVTIDAGTLSAGSAVAFNSAIPVSFTDITTGTLALNGFNTTIGALNGTAAVGFGTVINGGAATNTLTINSAVAGSFKGLLADGGAGSLALTISGAGNQTLIGNNTFTGDTNITGAGVLVVGSPNVLANSTLNMTVANSVQFSPAGTTPIVLGGLKGPANLLLQDTGAASIVLSIGNNNQNTQYNGVLSDGAIGSSVNKIGTGTLSFSQAPTYTGGTNVLTGVLAFDPPVGPALVMDGQIAGPGVVAATGPGALTLTNNNNTWSGGLLVSAGVTVNAGPWQTGTSDPLGAGAVTLNTGSTLNLAGSAAAAVPPPFDPTQSYRAALNIAGDSTVNVTGSDAATMGTLRIGAKLTLTGDPGSSLTLGKSTLTGPATVNPAANTTLILGAIGENPAGQSLSKTGAGIVVAGVPGSYTGGTAISNGILNVQANTALGAGAVGMTGGVLRLGPVSKQKFGLNVIGGFDAPTTAAGPLLATDVAGVVPISNWNNISTDGNNGNPFLGDGWSHILTNVPLNGGANINAPGAGINSPIVSTVVDNNGVATAATLAFNAQNGWSSSNSTANPNQKLMNGYLDQTTGPPPSEGGTGTPTRLTISNLPAGHVYDVYAYISSDTNGRIGHGSVAQDAVDGPFYVVSNDAGGFTGFVQATALTNPTAVPSNYMLFPAVTPGASVNPFSLNAANSIDLIWTEDVTGQNLGIAGLELVDVTPGVISASIANALNITGNATVDVTGGSSGGVTGALTIGSNTLFVTGGSSGANVPYTLTLGAATLNGNPTFDVANNGTGLGTVTLASMNDGGSVRTITKANVGTLEIDGASSLTGGAPGTSILVNVGTLRFNNTSGPASVGAGVSVTVASGATLQLAGTVSALSDPSAATHRAHIVNNSKQTSGGSLLVSGTHQQVGAIDGTGDTVVNAGGSLTANHIIQNALVIGGTAASAGTVTIAASDASGNSLAESGGLALAGSLTPSAGFGAGTLGSSSLLAASGSAASGASLSGSGFGGGVSSVPEPSTILLLALGSLACVIAALRRRKMHLES